MAIFERDPGTGELQQPADATACVSETGTAERAPTAKRSTGLRRRGRAPTAGTSTRSPAPTTRSSIFDRDPATGISRRPVATDGCISSTDGDCAFASPLSDPFGLALSPDGESVYVAAALDSAIVVFDRKLNNGLLVQKTGAGGCVAENGGACADGRGARGRGRDRGQPGRARRLRRSFTSDAVAIFDRDVPVVRHRRRRPDRAADRRPPAAALPVRVHGERRWSPERSTW